MVFVVDTVKLGQVFYKYFGFPVSVSFNQCSIAIFHSSATDNHSKWQHHQIKHFSFLAVTDSAHHICYFVGKTPVMNSRNDGKPSRHESSTTLLRESHFMNNVQCTIYEI
jgi:hypothetical protein